MRFVLLAILLAFPLFDLYVTTRVARWTGVPLWVWLAAGLLTGLLLLRSERVAFRSNTVAALHGEQSLFRGLLDSGRKVLAGILLILPGILSDLVALVLLLLPINHGRLQTQAATTARGGINHSKTIEGEFRRTE